MSLVSTQLETGYFAASSRLFEVAIAVPNLLVGALFPVLVRAAGDHRRRRRLALQRLYEGSVIAGVWVALATVLGAGFAIAVLAGDAGKPAVDVLRIQAPAFATSFMTVALIYGLLALHRHRALLLATSFGVVSLMVLTLVLAPSHGAVGTGLAVSIADAMLLVILAVLLKRARPDFQALSPVLPPVALAGGLALLSWLIPGVHDLVRVAVSTIVYFGTLMVLGAVPAQLRRAVLPGSAGR
jgi:O-antigen/teichoic acid export membrane protein